MNSRSPSGSNIAVASSRTRITGSFSKARARAIRCFCPPDGLACDPFVGAGTSAAAALDHGRRFVGGDLGNRTPDTERGLDGAPWVDVAARVLDERFKQQRLFGRASA